MSKSQLYLRYQTQKLMITSSGSVGELDPNCECKLLDDEDKEVADGQPGELYIRGPNVCLGYWRNLEATKETISSDGWLRTGDVAMCRNGWFWIVDRKKVRNYSILIIQRILQSSNNENRNSSKSTVSR